MMYNTFAVKGVILNHNEILILEKRLDKQNIVWDLAGGLIENNETDTETLIREVREELGIEIEIIRNVGYWQFQRHYDSKIVQVTNYLCIPKDQEIIIKLSEEHTSYKWINPKEIIYYAVKDISLIKNILENFTY